MLIRLFKTLNSKNAKIVQLMTTEVLAVSCIFNDTLNYNINTERCIKTAH